MAKRRRCMVRQDINGRPERDLSSPLSRVSTQAWRDRRNGNGSVDKSRYNDNYAGNGRAFRDSSRHVDV
jgi:hypothetical protein